MGSKEWLTDDGAPDVGIVRRILLATDHYPPLIGGAQIQTHLLARSLRDRGHDVAVATVWQHDLPAVEEIDGIPVYRLRQLRSLPGVARRRRQHQPPYPDPITVVGLRRLIGKLQPEVVHSYGWFSYSCAASLLGTDIPLVITARDYAYSCATRTLLHKERPCSGPALAKCLVCAHRQYGAPKGALAALGVRVSAPLLRHKVRSIQSISTYVQEIIRRDFIDDRRTGGRTTGIVIHDMVDPAPNDSRASSAVDAVGASLKRLPNEPFLLFVGALRRVKGVEQLLAAYARLTNPPPLVLLGTLEPDSPPFPPAVHVITDVPHEAVMAAWDRCLFGVLPSLLPEPFGTVVCEAMSRGKAVIGTRPGGHADMILDGETGILVPAGDVRALAEAMGRLIADSELRERMGQAGQRRAALFARDTILPDVELVYERVLAPRPPRPT